MTVLDVSDLHVKYDTVEALRGLNMYVEEEEIVGVIGPNGAGKTTLSDTVAGFKDYDGALKYRGKEVQGRQPRDLVREGLIYCTERRDLFGFMSVEDNLRMGSYVDPEKEDEHLEFVYTLFSKLEERKKQNARTLSGGEQQMLALGRALMGDPDFLVLDEPTIGLAPLIIEDISHGIQEINESGVTVLLAEQNVTFTMNHADRVYLLENGEFVREGSPEDLSKDEYVSEAYIG